jgi:hypothetical protein
MSETDRVAHFRGTEDREGLYAEWEWNDAIGAWGYYTPHRIFPHKDGKFTCSSADVWHDGQFDTFEAAELDALGISPEQADRDRETVARLAAAPAGRIGDVGGEDA